MKLIKTSDRGSFDPYNGRVAKGAVVACCVWAVACGRSDCAVQSADATIADAAVIPSCVGLAMTCGPAGRSSCCASTLVPGGTVFRSYDVGTDNMYPDKTNPATVSDFRLDTY